MYLIFYFRFVIIIAFQIVKTIFSLIIFSHNDQKLLYTFSKKCLINFTQNKYSTSERMKLIFRVLNRVQKKSFLTEKKAKNKNVNTATFK